MGQVWFGSEISNWIRLSGVRSQVNAQIAQLGQKADPAVDKATVDGKTIAAAEHFDLHVLYKPRHVLSTVEWERGDDRQTVRDLVDVPEHVFSVGRLDFESEGPVLITNNGDLTHQLTHSCFGHECS